MPDSEQQYDEQDIENLEGSEQQEKMLPQSQVNSLIGEAKRKAAEKTKAQLESEFQQRMESMNQGYSQEGQGDGQQGFDKDALYNEFEQRLMRQYQERQEEQMLEHAAESYLQKMQQGVEKYPDFEEVTKGFNPANHRDLFFMLSNLDNASDVVYELSKNPMKLAGLDHLAMRSPGLAQNELIRLASSIKDNEQAQAAENRYSVDAPLDSMQRSRVKGDNGELSISDYRRQDWLRG